MYKIRLQKTFFWNLQQMGKVTGLSCWHQDFVHKGLSAPAPGLYTCGKTLKKSVQNQNSKRFVWNLQQMVEVIRAFYWHQKFVPKGFSALAPGLNTCIKSFKMCLKSYFKEIVLKLATNGQSDKGFLLTSTFAPKGLSATGVGLYTYIKALKYIPGLGVRWAFTGPLVLCCFGGFFPNLRAKPCTDDILVAVLKCCVDYNSESEQGHN